MKTGCFAPGFSIRKEPGYGLPTFCSHVRSREGLVIDEADKNIFSLGETRIRGL